MSMIEFVLMKKYVPGEPSQIVDEDMETFLKDLQTHAGFEEAVVIKEGNCFICLQVPSDVQEAASLKTNIGKVPGWVLIERAGYRVVRPA